MEELMDVKLCKQLMEIVVNWDNEEEEPLYDNLVDELHDFIVETFSPPFWKVWNESNYYFRSVRYRFCFYADWSWGIAANHQRVYPGREIKVRQGGW